MVKKDDDWDKFAKTVYQPVDSANSRPSIAVTTLIVLSVSAIFIATYFFSISITGSKGSAVVIVFFTTLMLSAFLFVFKKKPTLQTQTPPKYDDMYTDPKYSGLTGNLFTDDSE